MWPLADAETTAELLECSRAHAELLRDCVQREVEVLAERLSCHSYVLASLPGFPLS
jgi:hypothetical protein